MRGSNRKMDFSGDRKAPPDPSTAIPKRGKREAPPDAAFDTGRGRRRCRWSFNFRTGKSYRRDQWPGIAGTQGSRFSHIPGRGRGISIPACRRTKKIEAETGSWRSIQARWLVASKGSLHMRGIPTAALALSRLSPTHTEGPDRPESATIGNCSPACVGCNA